MTCSYSTSAPVLLDSTEEPVTKKELLFRKVYKTIQENLPAMLVLQYGLHGNYMRLKGVSTESVFLNLLEQNGFPNVRGNGNKASIDIFVTEDGVTISISVKTGFFDKKNSFVFSGSRLQKYKTLIEKLDHIDHTHADYYICLSSDQNLNADQQLSATANDPYVLFAFPSSILDYSNVKNWKKDGKNLILNSVLMKAKIAHSMSEQLWTTILDGSIFDRTVYVLNH